MSKKSPVPQLLTGLALLLAGAILTVLLRTPALAEGASKAQTIPFALALIVALVGFTIACTAFVKDHKTDIRTLSAAALCAALCYVGFAFLKFDIPAPGGSTAFHLGNVFCVLAALLLGGYWGGMAGAVGMTIADLTTTYVTSAPKTFLLKLLIGLIVGFVAHKVLKLNKETDHKKAALKGAVAATAGMAFNVVADPIVGYFYKTYLFGIPQDWAKTLAKLSAVTTLFNAVVAVVVASILYGALRPALHRAGFLK